MKILKNKTYHEMMDTNAHLDEVNYNLTNNNAILTNKVILLERRVNELESEKAYLNLTRDSKGVLHSSVKKEKKVVKHRVKKVLAAASKLSGKEFAELHAGKTAIYRGEKVFVCGHHNSKNITIGFTGNQGWRRIDPDDVIIFNHPSIKSYYYIDIFRIESQLIK